jgi:hypothetical protein
MVLQSSSSFSSLEFDLSLLMMIKYSARFIPAFSKSSRLENDGQNDYQADKKMMAQEKSRTIKS